MAKNLIKDRVAGFKSGYTKRVDKISKKLKLGKKYDELSKSKQKRVEMEYKKKFPNKFIQPENFNDDSKLRKIIKQIPIKGQKNKSKKSLPKNKRKGANMDHDMWVAAGIDAGKEKRHTEGLGNLRGKKKYYDVMKVYSIKEGFSKPTCFCCKNTDWKFLAFDHITKRPESHKHISGVSLAKKLENDGYPKGIQILCHNCNTAKEIFGRVRCPHHLSKSAQKKLKAVKLPLGKILKR